MRTALLMPFVFAAAGAHAQAPAAPLPLVPYPARVTAGAGSFEPGEAVVVAVVPARTAESRRLRSLALEIFAQEMPSRSVRAGPEHGSAVLLRLGGSAAAGAESFAGPSRDLIGGFHAHTIAVAWRQSLLTRLGLALLYAHQSRSDGTTQDSYSLGLVQRW